MEYAVVSISSPTSGAQLTSGTAGIIGARFPFPHHVHLNQLLVLLSI